MSPSVAGQPCIGLHFTLKKDWPRVRTLLPLIEKQLQDCNPAPHWGKLFTMPPEQIQPRYPQLAEFRKLVEGFDPRGKFRKTSFCAGIFFQHERLENGPPRWSYNRCLT